MTNYFNWRLYHTFKPKELFLTFNIDRLKITQSEIIKYSTKERKRAFAISVFTAACRLLINDIIIEGKQFMFREKQSMNCSFFLDCIEGKRYKALHKSETFKQFDPINTNFKIYQVCYQIEKPNGFNYKKPVSIGKEFTEKLVKLANNNAIKVGPIVTVDYYIEKIKELYPYLCIEDISLILKHGFNKMNMFLLKGADIIINDQNFIFITGNLYSDQDKMFKYVLKQMAKRARILYGEYQMPWDGYYYFSIPNKQYLSIKEALEKKEEIDFGELKLYKLYDDMICNSIMKHAIFRVKATVSASPFAVKEHLITSNAELIDYIRHWEYDTINPKNRKYKVLYNQKKRIQHIRHNNVKEASYLEWKRQNSYYIFKTERDKLKNNKITI